jgi:hypothetical protein
LEKRKGRRRRRRTPGLPPVFKRLKKFRSGLSKSIGRSCTAMEVFAKRYTDIID